MLPFDPGPQWQEMTLKTEPVTRAQDRKIPTLSIERTVITKVGSPFSLGIMKGTCPLATAQNNINDIAPQIPPAQMEFLAPNRSAIAPGMNDKSPALKKTAEIVSSWLCVR
mmetsp:Transcript_18225/g.45278  ORF Transcript_18225/g.45278 Transcript_18225/m.45278 type:complete len:111 (+) Transcript_18225:1445-1777(+)